MSRCKSHFCGGFVDFTIDERGELCPKCMQSIFPDLQERLAKKVQLKLDRQINQYLKFDIGCEDE